MKHYKLSAEGANWLKLIAGILFVSIIALTEYFIHEYRNKQQAERDRSAAELAIRLKSQLETELHGATFLTHGIEAYVVARKGNVVPAEINSMLEQVYSFSPFFRNIGIAPDNEIRWVMPIEGNEAALGVKYENLASQWPEIKKIIASKNARLHGPLELVQGDLGLIYRAPLYIDGAYWGLISAVIDAESLFESLMDEVAEVGTSVKLAIKQGDKNNFPVEGVFWGNPSTFNTASATTLIDIPGGRWLLAIETEKTLPNFWLLRAVVWGLSFIGVLGFFYLTRHFYQQKLLNSLSTEVESRTKELSDVNSKLYHVLNAASETAIIATDKNGLINVFNRGAERMLGYSSAEVVHKETPAIFHDPEEVEAKGLKLSKQLGRNISGFAVFTAIPDIEGSEKDSWTYITKSGGRIPVEVIVTKEFDNDGNAVGYLGLASDMSQQVNDQRALKELKERLESATQVANIGVWELNLKTREMLWNGQMHSLTGVKSEDFKHSYHSIESVFYHEEKHEFNELLKKLERKATNAEPFIEIPLPLETTFRIIRADNEELRWMKGHAVIQCDNAGVPESMLGAMHDISSLVFAKEAAEQAEKLKSQFLSTVSHELRTPLSVISGSLSLMSLEAETLSEETKHVLELANRNSKRLTLLINDLLDIEKLSSGSLSFQIKEYSLEFLVQKAIAENQGYAAQHQAKILLNRDISANVHIAVDELRFMQVMANLLSNAAKFSPNDGEIKVDTSIAEGNALVEVIDRGPGIPEVFKNRVFEPFAQAESSDSRSKGGTGLGLAITKTIIEKMGGTIGFESVPGEKTRFWLLLPIVTHDSTTHEVTKLGKQANRLNYAPHSHAKANVLHVEDYDDFSTVITAILKDTYEVDTARTIRQAKQKLSSQNYDFLVLDIALPDGSGWELVDIAKKVNNDIQVIVTSDYDTAPENMANVDAIMSKATFTRSKFVGLIDKLSKDKDRSPDV